MFLLVASLGSAAGGPADASSPDCSQLSVAITHLEGKVQEARREIDIRDIENTITSGMEWASAELDYLKPRLTFMMHVHDTGALTEAWERVEYSIGMFNQLTRLDTDEATFVVRSFGDAFLSFYREAYVLACEAPPPEGCSTYGQGIAHLSQLAVALPDMTSDPEEIRSAQKVAFQYARTGFNEIAFERWQDALKHTDFPFVQDRMMRARTNAIERSRDADAQHQVTNTTLALHEVIHSVFCARP